MKNLFLSIIIMAICSCGFAQTIRPIEQYFNYNNSNNVYFKDVNNIFTSFLGTWEYSTPDKYFKITFTKHVKGQVSPLVTKLTQYTDGIVSDFQYKEKVSGAWITRYNTYNTNYSYISFFGVESFTSVTFFYTEPQLTGTCERSRTAKITLALPIPVSTPAQLQWTRVNNPTGSDLDEPCPDGTARDTSEFIIPANMVLTKVN